MSKLLDFLTENPVDNLTEQLELSLRLKGMPFTIRAMTGDEFTTYQQAATNIRKGKKVDFNSKKFNELVVINHTVEPNLKDAAAIKKAGCHTPEQFLNKALLSGEIVELSNRISSLSGFDQDMDELVDDAKNSLGQETVTPNTPISASSN